MKLVAFVVLLSAAAALAQDYQDYEVAPRAAPVRLRPGNGPIDSRPAPTPVPILKQINRHNEDGSYTYGYEGADGSFKIETKLATGEVKGKYGYVDETGKVRVVEYGANKYGFQPSGEGITVAPPTLVDETTNKDRLLPEYDDEPQRPYIARVQQRPQSRPPPPPPRPSPRPQPQYDDYDEPAPPQRPQYSSGPSPPRIQVPGAQSSGDVTYSPQPRPARPDPEYSQNTGFSLGPPQHSNVRVSRPVSLASLSQGPVRPVSEPSYQPSYQAPRPAPQPAPQYAAPSHQQGRSTSVLDQLAKDYALPQSGAQPLHDISFGYY